MGRRRHSAHKIRQRSPHTLPCPCDTQLRTGTHPLQCQRWRHQGIAQWHMGSGKARGLTGWRPVRTANSRDGAISARRQGIPRLRGRACTCHPRPTRTAPPVGRTHSRTRPCLGTESLHKLRQGTTHQSPCRVPPLWGARTRLELRWQGRLHPQPARQMPGFRPSQQGTQAGRPSVGAQAPQGKMCHRQPQACGLHTRPRCWRCHTAPQRMAS